MRQLLRIIFSLLLLTAAGSGTHADAVLETNLAVEEFTLDNGMLFLVVKRPAMPQVAVRLAIRAGSALEENGKTGIAHLLEHMMFKGTKNFGTLDRDKDLELQKKIEAAYQVVLQEEGSRRPDRELIQRKLAEMDGLRGQVQNIYVPQAFSSQLGKNGAVGINAFTSQDQTQYVASVPADMLEQWFSIISEQIFEPSWREFYVEKDVVQREWAFRYVNNPVGAAWLDLDATAYTAHPYRNPTIGWRSDMEKFNTTDAIAFHRRYYTPANAVCVLVGDLTLEEARRLAHTYFDRYPAGSRSPESVTAEPPQEGPRRSVRYLKGARTPLVQIGFHGAPMGTKDFYALDVMTMLLSQGRSARLTQDLTNKGLATEAWAANPDNRFGGMVILGGSPNEPKELTDGGPNSEEARRTYFEACRDLENRLLAEVENLKEKPAAVAELERVKKLNQRDFIERMRSNESLASTLATLEVQTGWRYVNTYLDAIAAVEPADVQRVARTYLNTKNQTSVYVIPGGEPQEQPAAYTEVRSVGGKAAARVTAPVDLANHSIYPTAAGWRHPLSFERKPVKVAYPPAESVSAGGAGLFFMHDTELPTIDLTLLVKAGRVDLDPSKTGLTGLLNDSLVNGGTERHTPEALALLLDENAIMVSVAAGEEDTAIRLSVLKDDWEKGLNLLQEILTQPAFTPEVIAVVKEQALIGLKRQGENAQAVAMREGAIWHFDGHPYGRDPLKGLETIPTIDGEDLKRFLRIYFVPANMVAAVSGDISREAAVAGISRLMDSLPHDPPPARRIGLPAATPPVLALVPKAGQIQSQVALYLNGPERTDPEFWKLRLLVDVMGGSDSLMYTRLRDDLGLVYSAGFFQTYKWNAGALIGFIGCKGDKTGMAITETLDIMGALRQKIPSEDLDRKRLEALNSFVFNVDTPHDLVTTYARYQMRGEPLDTLDRIQQAFIDTGRSELEGLARRYLDPQRIQIFVVADQEIPVGQDSNGVRTLTQDLDRLAATLGLPYREIALR
ncbi:MAG: pitrilysin family protein [Desulfobacterales bacterium]